MQSRRPGSLVDRSLARVRPRAGGKPSCQVTRAASPSPTAPGSRRFVARRAEQLKLCRFGKQKRAPGDCCFGESNRPERSRGHPGESETAGSCILERRGGGKSRGDIVSLFVCKGALDETKRVDLAGTSNNSSNPLGRQPPGTAALPGSCLKAQILVPHAPGLPRGLPQDRRSRLRTEEASGVSKSLLPWGALLAPQRGFARLRGGGGAGEITLGCWCS